MSNPGSPAVSVGAEGSKTEAKKDNGNGNGGHSVALHLDPFVRLDPLDVSDVKQCKQSSLVKKKSGGDGTGKVTKGGNNNGGGESVEVKIKLEDEPGKEADATTTASSATTTEDTEVALKPRRPSVHFAEPAVTGVQEAGVKPKGNASGGVERSRQENSRKHRSRKEKLVCRSESPSDLGMESGSRSLPSALTPTRPMTPVSAPPMPSHTLGLAAGPSDAKKHQIDAKPKQSTANMPSPQIPSASTSSGATRVSGKASASRYQKAPLKRSVSSSSNNGGFRKSSPMFLSGSSPVVKKKKVIEIVSPRKRKPDHIDLMKTSSDPILVRATNVKSYKLKNKSRHNRLKFSRAKLNKSSSQMSGTHRIRRESSSSVSNMSSMKALQQKKDSENEQSFPAAVLDELMWVLQEAEKEFAPPKSNKSVSGSHTISHPSQLSFDMTGSSSSSPVKNTFIGRRRLDSEATSSIGFEMAPSSPSGSQSFYHLRKEIYFSPSPSYAAPGPSGRRRYSRRRHARIHPPFDGSNCNFQGHLCPNSKVPNSQFCEKHLDQGPTTGYSHCRFMKDGRQCGQIFSSYDPAATFCEDHSYLVGKTEYDRVNPTVPPDPAKNIVSRINKILTDGLLKTDVDRMDSSNPIILQLAEESDVVQDLPLGSFTGGLLEECDSEGERNFNPDKPDYDALKNAGYFTTEEVIQIHINKLRKLKTLYQREKELEWLIRQSKFRAFKDNLDKLKHVGPRFTTNPYLIDKLSTELPKEYMDHQIKEYEAAKAILQTAYKTDGERGLLRHNMQKNLQELQRMAKATRQKQQDTLDIYDLQSDVDSDSGEPRERREATKHSGIKPFKCAYNEGYAIRACPNPPINRSHFCSKHILSDSKQVQWVPCNRRIGPDPQDVCKTPVLKLLEKHGCAVHAPLLLTHHKPLKRSEEELNAWCDSDNEEEEVALEEESAVLENLVSDECIGESHLDEMVRRVGLRGALEITDTSDSEETDEETGGMLTLMTNSEESDSLLQSSSSF